MLKCPINIYFLYEFGPSQILGEIGVVTKKTTFEFFMFLSSDKFAFIHLSMTSGCTMSARSIVF